MNDQLTAGRPTTPIIAFASGKGGAGKTSLCLNLATMLAKAGKNILVFDADIGLANVDVQLGLHPDKDLAHVIQGMAQLEDIVVKSERGFSIIPGRSGYEKVSLLNAMERRNLLNGLRTLASGFDAVFIDVAAGVDEQVLGFANFADRTLLVTTPDPSSITDAYAVVKLLKIHHDKTNCTVLINQAGSEEEGRKTYEKLATAASKFLGLSLPLAGVVPYDRQYATAVKMQELACVAYPNSAACKSLATVGQHLLEHKPAQ